MLSQYNGTLVVVSHNRDFLDKLVNKILYFKGNGEVVIFNGGYHDFLAKKDELIFEEKTNKSLIEKNKSIKNKIQIKKKLTYKLKFELENLPKQIDNLKEELYDLEKIISDKSLYEEDNKLFIQTSKKIGSLQIDLQEKEDRWLELMEMEDSSELS